MDDDWYDDALKEDWVPDEQEEDKCPICGDDIDQSCPCLN
jgi:hypothetical protein